MTTSEHHGDLVRRTSELLTDGAPLREAFAAFCELLAAYVDASVVFIALESERGVHIEYVYDHGEIALDAHVPVAPLSQTERVMHSGTSLLFRGPEEMPPVQIPLVIPGAGEEDGASAVFVPLRFGGRTTGVLSVQSQRAYAYDHSDLALLETCALYIAVAVALERGESSRERADILSTIDPVSGAAARRVFDERLLHEWTRARRTGGAIGLILVDVDRFATFNAFYGHVAGDACLAQIAQAIRSAAAGRGALLARYGGEEFAVLLPAAESADASLIGDRICEAVRELAIPYGESPDGVITVSAGAAVCDVTSAQPPRLLRAADRALFSAKHAGRDRCIAGDADVGDDPPGKPLGNLPETPPIVGRAVELDALARSLALSRLTTVTGAAGIGKTALALAAAQQLVYAYANGAWVVPCQDLREDDGLAAHCCTVLGLLVGSYAGADRALLAHLASRHTLLVLDGCDRVAAEADALIQTLLESAPRLSLLVTAREPIGCAHERLYPLGELRPADAEALYMERSGGRQAIDTADLRVLGTRAARFDGLPQAIELAAAGAYEVPADISAAKVTSWACHGASPSAQRLLARLTIFGGAFDAEAVREICAFPPLRIGSAVAAFEELTQRRLVRPDTARPETHWRVPGEIAAIASERFAQPAEYEELIRRHLVYFVDDIERRGVQPEMPLADVRDAITRSLAHDRPDFAIRLIAASAEAFVERGAARALRCLIAATQARPTSAEQRCRLGIVAAAAARAERDWPGMLEAAGAAYRCAQDDLAQATAARVLAAARHRLGDETGAANGFDEAARYFRNTGALEPLASVLLERAEAAAASGSLRAARAAYQEALQTGEEADDVRSVAHALYGLAACAAAEGAYDDASRHANESLALYERLGDRTHVAACFIELSRYRLERGAGAAASAALRTAQTILREHPDPEYAARLLDTACAIAFAQQRFELCARLSGHLREFRARERLCPDPLLANGEARMERALREILGERELASAFAFGAMAPPEELTQALLR